MVLFCREGKGTLTISVQVQPRARKTELVGVQGDVLKVKVAAPPVEGEANEALIGFFAKLFDVSKSHVRVKLGGQSKRKVIEIDGVTTAELTALLIQRGLLSIKLG